MQRLDKLLSDAGVASRRELKTVIKAGRVEVNGRVVKSPEAKVDEIADEVKVDGTAVGKRRRVLLMLHKPAGYVTATEDAREKTVMELLPAEYRRLDVKPVGRLDKDTEGLLLFTNDGALLHDLISPRRHVWKRYYAEHTGQAGPEDQAAFQTGLTLGDGAQCLPAVLFPLGPGRSLVDIHEGMYHQVRRMLAARGMPVTYLRRISFGGLSLGQLAPGEIQEVAVETVLEPPCDIAQAGSRWVFWERADGV